MSSMVPDAYPQILEALKAKIQDARPKSVITANAHMLAIYWDIGYTIAGQEKEQGWGAKIVEQLARDLKTAFPDFALHAAGKRLEEAKETTGCTNVVSACPFCEQNLGDAGKVAGVSVFDVNELLAQSVI